MPVGDADPPSPADRDAVKLSWLALAAAVSWIGAARAESPQALPHQYKCYSCHADDESKTGPAYADVAARYRDNPRAAAILSAEIRKGAHGGGPWHMPPHPEVSAADAKTMTRYILSLKR
jgi:cytochrome c